MTACLRAARALQPLGTHPLSKDAMKTHCAIALALATLPASGAEPGLQITVSGLKHEGTPLHCALFSKPEGFPKDAAALATVTAPVTGGIATCVFARIPPGTYAVAAFEDRNGNGKLDSNVLGQPTEGYAFSRDARARFGPPKFDAAAFAYAGGTLTMQLRIEY